MAKGKTQVEFNLDTGCLQPLMASLYRVEHQAAKETVEKALTEAAQRISMDTHIAMNNSNLPAHGKYWTGKTAGTIIDDTAPRWEGGAAWVPIGFSKPVAAAFLISGTPKMKSNPVLHKMYKGKTYMKDIQDEMFDKLNAKIQEEWDKK